MLVHARCASFRHTWYKFKTGHGHTLLLLLDEANRQKHAQRRQYRMKNSESHLDVLSFIASH